jgi:cytochrome P450
VTSARIPALDQRVVAADLIDDPYPFYERLRHQAPVWNLPGTNAYFVSTWELIAEAASRVDDFSNHFRHMLFSEDDGALGVLPTGSGPDVFAGADPPTHTEHRKLFFPELVQKKMQELESYVSALADHRLDDVLDTRGWDAASLLANWLPIQVVAERVIGFRDVDIAQVQHWTFAGSQFSGGCLTLGQMTELGAAAAGLLPWVTAQLDHAIAAPATGDVLSATLAGMRAGVLTHEEAAFNLMVLLGAGSETTTSLIGNAICMLADRVDLQAALRRDPVRLPDFVDEVLRFESPFRFHPRSVPHDTDLGGVRIPQGSMVVLLWASANRDPAVFEHPDNFMLDRTNARMHMGFGRGIHFCVGAPLARLEARVVLERLLARTRSFTLGDPETCAWVPNLWVRRHERVPIVVTAA